MGIFNWHANCTSEERIDGKTVVVTGSNQGIGKETVLDLYKRGGHIIMACRDLGKTKVAQDEIETMTAKTPNCGSLSSVHLDLNSLASVRNCAKQLLKDNSQINILINNAGIMSCPFKLTEDNFESQIGVNHLGHFLLTCLLLPRMRASTPARIVTVSSKMHEFGSINFNDIMSKNSYSPTNAYSQSKLANILFTKELAKRLQGSGVTAYALHPGIIATNLFQHFSNTYIPGLTWSINKYTQYFGKTPRQGAQTTIYCAIDKKCVDESGLYYSECRVTSESRKARDMEVAAKLWELSALYVGLKDWDPFTIVEENVTIEIEIFIQGT